MVKHLLKLFLLTLTLQLTYAGFSQCQNFTSQIDSAFVICVTGDSTGYSHQFNPTISGGTAPFTYAWSISPSNSGSLSSSTILNPTVTTFTGQLTVTFILTDSMGCVVVDSVLIDTNCQTTPPPCNLGVQISSFDTICVSGDTSGYTYQLNPTITGGTAPYTYQWVIQQNNSGSLSSTTIFNPIVSTWTSQLDVLLTVTDDNGCMQNDTIVIDTTCQPTQPCNLNVMIDSLSVICVTGDSSGYSYQFSPTITGGTTPYTYQWYLSPSNSGTLSSTTVVNPIVTTFTGTLDVVLMVTDGNGCVQLDSVLIDTNCQTPPPCNLGVQIHASDTICVWGDSTGYDYQMNPVITGGSAPYTYQWSFLQSNSGMFSLSTIANPVVDTWTAHLDVLLTVTDANGCVQIDTVVLDTTCQTTPPCNLGVQIHTSDTICVWGDSTGYDYQMNPVITGGSAPYTYQWSFLQSNSGMFSLSTIANPVVDTWTAHLDVLLTVTDANGCVQLDTVVLDTTCQTTPPCNLGVQIHTSDTICVLGDSTGYSYQFNPTITGGTAPYTYLWNYVPNNSASFSSTTILNPTVTTFTGYLGVLLTVTDANGCVQLDTVVLDTTCQTTPPPCNLGLQIDSAYVICVSADSSGYSYQFNPTVTGGTAPYLYYWQIGSGNLGFISSANALNPVVYTYTEQLDVVLIVTDANGCVAADSVILDTNCIVVPVGINEFEGDNFTFNLYPSPVTDQLTIASSNLLADESIVLFNFTGQRIVEIQSAEKQEIIDVSDLANGIYFIQFKKANKTAKIIVSH